MRKSSVLALLVLVAVIFGAGVPLLLGQTGGVRPPMGGGQPNDIPRQTARTFAPFIRTVILRRTNQAQQTFKVRRSALQSLEQAETVNILARLQKPDTLNLSLIGGRILGQNVGVLLFTITNEQGPVYFKIYYYGYGDMYYVDRVEVGDEWEGLEAATATVEMLSMPITVPLGDLPDMAP